MKMRLTDPLVLAVLALAAGYRDQPDARWAKFAEQSIQAQARQNEQMADQSRQIAEASRELVAADAEARRELTAAHAKRQQDLQQERGNLDRQRMDLDQDRRDLQQERRVDPIIAEAITAVGVLLACLAPLALAGYVLDTIHRPDTEAEAVNELLLSEFTAERPILLTFPPRPLAEWTHASPSLSAPEELGSES